MMYEQFRDRIGGYLLGLGYPITWSEIRENLALPQKFPNNKWVRRMEADIGLKRERDRAGKMMWSVVAATAERR